MMLSVNQRQLHLCNISTVFGGLRYMGKMLVGHIFPLSNILKLQNKPWSLKSISISINQIDFQIILIIFGKERNYQFFRLFTLFNLSDQQIIKQMKYQEDDQYSQAYVELPSIKARGSPPKKKLKAIIANLVDTQYDVVEEVCWDLNYDIICEKESKNWDIKWVDSAVSVQILSKMQSHQKINHFPGMNTLSRKNNLAKNMMKMQYEFPQHYSYIPKTFLLPQDLSLLRTYVNDNYRKGITKTFIVKPQASSQGRGIFLSQQLPQIQQYGQCVVQNYIDNPLLYKGLKFDMRIYALVAGCDPLRIYIYNEGLVRFATEKYQKVNQDNIDNMYMHLTNYAINKDSPKYVFNESLDNLSLGHKKSLAQYFQTLKNIGLPAHEYWSGIKDTIVKTVISGQPHLQHEYRMAQPHNIPNNMCFQILGFDFMIDDNDKLYLLQINYTPSFSTQTPLDHLIKSNLIRDTLILMNVTPSSRNHAQKIAREELERRVYTGKSIKLTPQQRQRQAKIQQQQRDQYQKKHLGSFQKIYPCRNPQRQQKYQKLLQYSSQQYRQANSPQKIGHVKRSNSKYRIKRIISNNTLNDQQQRQNQSIKVKSYLKNTNKANAIINPQFIERPLISKSKKYPRASEIDNQAFQMHYQVRQRNFGQQMREMDLMSLKTKQQQKTMFSRQYDYVDPLK